MNNSPIITLTDASFDEDVLSSELPVLVDFWAEWCGPCKALAPTLEEYAKNNLGKIKVCKLNVDENPKSPAQYIVRGIPTLILFKGGKAEDRKVGALSKPQLEDFLKSHLA